MLIELLWAYAKLHVTLLFISFSINPEVKNMYDLGKKRTVKTLIKQVKQAGMFTYGPMKILVTENISP